MKFPTSRHNAGLLIPLLLGIYLVGTSGFSLLPEVGVFNGKRILELLLLLLILSVTVLNSRLRVSFRQLLGTLPRWAVYSLVLAGLAGTLSSLRFPHPGYGLLEVAMPVLMVLAVFATAAARRICSDSFDRMALLIVVALGLVAAITELMGLFASWMMGLEYQYNYMLVRFFHPRFYNQLQTFSIPLIAALPFIFGSSRKLKVIAVTLIGLQWCLVLISGGRGTTVSLVAAFTLSALLFPSNRRVWLGIHASGLILGVALFFSVLGFNQSVNPEGEQFVSQSIGRPMAHTSGRTYMWNVGWHQALEQPLLGAGPARFDCELNPAVAAHPHSFPVKLLAEWGFPAFVLVIAVCLWLGWRLVVKCRQEQDGQASSDILVAMLGCSIMAATVHSLVSGVLIMPASQVMTILIGGWALGRLNVAAMQTQASQLATVLTLAAGWVLAVSVGVFSIHEYQKMDLRIHHPDRPAIREPRYWVHGHACNYVYESD